MINTKNDKIIVVDIELTCWETPPPQGMSNEIIEIGICEIDLKQKKISRHDSYFVKPEHSEVSEFCTQLTGITENMIKKAPNLRDVCKTISKKYSSNRPWCAWGRDDIEIKNECLAKKAEYFCSEEFINLGKICSLMSGQSKNLGMKSVLENMGMEFKGEQHRAMDDAINTAHIFIEMMDILQYKINPNPNEILSP